MQKRHWLIPGAIALGVTCAAWAASISNLSGQSCGDDTGAWHFVNNQTGGGSGTLDVCFTTGCFNGVPAVESQRIERPLQRCRGRHLAECHFYAAGQARPFRLHLRAEVRKGQVRTAEVSNLPHAR